MSINKVILVGNVGKDPEIRVMTNGSKLATFSLATTDVWKDKTTGEKKEKTEWHKIIVYSQGLVNVAERYVKKGSKLYIEGALQTRKWTGADGIEKYATEIVLQGFNATLQILDTRGSSQDNGAPISEGDVKNTFTEANLVDENDFIDDDKDFIPF